MSSIPSIIFSFLTLVLPLHTIWRLQLRLVQKIGLTIIFVLASLDLAVAIIRLWVSTQYHLNDVSCKPLTKVASYTSSETRN